MHFSPVRSRVLTTCALAFTLHTAVADVLTPARLSALQAEARAAHPTVAAARARVAAAGAAIRTVRLWEDPTVGAGLMAAREEMRRNEGDLKFSAGLMLPRPALTEARRSRAAAMGEALSASAAGTGLALDLATARAAIGLALTDEALTLQADQTAWLKTMTTTARDRAADPQSSAADPLRLESELAIEEQALLTLREERRGMAEQVNLLTGRPTGTAWPVLTLPPPPAPPPLETELARLSLTNPQIQALRHMATAAKAGEDIARRERDPLLGLTAEASAWSGGRVRSGMIGVSVTLPWFNDPVYAAGRDQARSEAAAATAEIDSARRELAARVIAAWTSARTATAASQNYQSSVLPKSEAAVSALESAWLSRRATLAEVLDARRRFLAASLEERRQRAASLTAAETLHSLAPRTP